MRSEGYGSCCVCVCVCVCVSFFLSVYLSISEVTSHLWGFCSVGNEDQNICGVFSETARSQITHMRIVHMQVLQGSRCDARAPCCKLSLRST